MNDIAQPFGKEITEKSISSDIIKEFQGIIYDFYEKNPREFLWRETKNPYYILVSEFMLQQTQAERVIPKYELFIKTFHDLEALARAPQDTVIKLWQGLGYNRRAIALRNTAEIIVNQFDGKVPSTIEELESLPGIGPATACEIASFAYNKPSFFIETNIRRVFIYFFFAERDKIKDVEILPLVKKTLDSSNPRKWYYALMDYGVMLKKRFPDLNKKSAHYRKQKPFKGSNREIRGKLLKILLANPIITQKEIFSMLKFEPERVKNSIKQLQKEGFLNIQDGKLRLTK